MAGVEGDGGNTMRILVATDIHLGYMEKDAIRGNDSLNTFEEILAIAVKEDVDFILHGGDLFHDNKPSRKTIHGCMTLLRKYCFGDRPCGIEYLSDQSVDFGHTPFPVVNYEDPNLNVSMPFFSIHGNHDDPAGQGSLCSLDLLSVAGLVNFFGRYTSLDKINLRPVLLQKGTTRLALYGLGAVRDERLHRVFINKNIAMMRPRENQEDWFNLFVIHQNRSKHGPTNYIPEQFLEDFLDLVIWGHEHECLIDPVENPIQKFFVSQPGSSIATSLSEGETRQKHVGVLTIKDKMFKMRKIKLETVRQFYFRDIILKDTTLNPDHPKQKEKTEKYIKDIVEEILDKADVDRTGNTRQPEQPLLRLRVDYSGGFDPFSVVRFGQQFVNRIANPRDLVLFTRKKALKLESGLTGDDKPDYTALKRDVEEGLEIGRVEDLVRQHFALAEQNQRLQLLTERGMGEAIREYVDKEENMAIEELVKHQLNKTQEHLHRRSVNEDTLEQEVVQFKQRKKVAEEDAELEEAMNKAKQMRQASDTSSFGAGDVDEPGNESDESNTSHRGRGGRGGRGRGGRGGGRGRGSRSKAAVVEKTQTSISSMLKPKVRAASPISIEDSDDDMMTSFSSSSHTQNSRGRRGASQNSTRGRPAAKQSYFGSSDEDDIVPARKRRR